jgi:hypothetical protein
VYTALPEVGESNDCIRLRKYVLEKDIVSSVIGGDGDVEVYMCPHTAICVLILLYVSSYCVIGGDGDVEVARGLKRLVYEPLSY